MSNRTESLLEQGYRARSEHRAAEAKDCFLKAIDLCTGTEERALLARALTGLGQIERDLEDLPGALKHYQDAVQIYRTLDNPLALAHTIRHAGDILRNARQLDLAAACYVDALSIYRENSATLALDLANAIRGFALVKGEAGDGQEAKLLWKEAARLYAEVGVQPGVDESEAQLARLNG